MESFSSKVTSNIKAQVTEVQEASKMMLEKIESKINDISVADKDSKG
jgi:hypothetical protein